MNFISFSKHIYHNRVVRIMAGIVITGAAAIVLFAFFFTRICASSQPDFKPIQEQPPAEIKQIEGSIQGYHRTEETTYITFPEWYLVFNPQEYAAFLSKNLPSGFRYFSSVTQAWGSYCRVYGIATRNYPPNPGNQVVEAVIVTSFSVENIIKGVYENTFGRISEWLGSNERTEEDNYAAAVATEYGTFIPTRPWYEFPFGQKLSGLWKETPLFGRHLLRKWERKFFLSLEYGVKDVYARLIGIGTHTAYGVAETEVYAHVKNAPASIFGDQRIRKIRDLGNNSYIITLPHYQGFTDTAPTLARTGLQFLDIAGNDEILMSVIAPRAWKYDISKANVLFKMDLMTTGESERLVIQMPVRSLCDSLRTLETESVRIEHLFDY